MPRDKKGSKVHKRSIILDRSVKGRNYFKSSIPPALVRKVQDGAADFVPFVGLLTKDDILFFEEMPTQELRCPFCNAEIDPHEETQCFCGAQVSLTETPDAVSVPNYDPDSGLVYPLLPDDVVDRIEGTGLITVYFSR